MALLLANMTEFGRTPPHRSRVSGHGLQNGDLAGRSLRVANKAQANCMRRSVAMAALQAMVDRMQTRAELYAAIGYHDYEALDASPAVKTVIRK